MISTLGWINVGLIMLMASIYPIKNTYLRKIREGGKRETQPYGNVYHMSRKVHPILGIFIVLIGLYHGWSAFGRLPLHTGTLVLGTIILMGMVAFIGPRIKGFQKKWRMVHRRLGLPLVLLVIIHIYWRNLI